jgi:hypothetical protein
MSPVSHQTIKLSKGKHSSPETGACVMELASMLAGESFSDHPQSVCPAIAGLLRSYNDSIDDRRRQDLYPYAAKAVGSRSTPQVERDRARRLLSFASEMQRARGWTRFMFPNRLGPAVLQAQLDPETAGAHAAKSIRKHTEQSHAAALALIDELLATGPRDRVTVPCDLLPEEELMAGVAGDQVT